VSLESDSAPRTSLERYYSLDWYVVPRRSFRAVRKTFLVCVDTQGSQLFLAKSSFCILFVTDQVDDGLFKT